MDDLIGLLEYHHWATNSTVNAVKVLSPEQFTRDLGSSFPSVHETLVHVFTADRAWLGRLEGQAPPRANADDYATLDSLLEVWEPVLTRWPGVVETLGDAGRLIEYKSFAGDPFTNPLVQIVRHVVNHGTYHRGQVATMLRQLGVQPISSDLIGFYRERGGPQA